MKQIILIVLGAVLFLVLIVYLIGLFLPVKHTVTVTRAIGASSDSVWRKITTFSEYQSWRKNLTRVDVVSDDQWIETDARGDSIPFRMSILEDRKKVKVDITGVDLAFGGHWIIELKDKGDSTDVTITENGKVYSAVFRVMSKFVFGHDTTIREYLKHLAE